MYYDMVSEHDDVYFTKAKNASMCDGLNNRVLYQVFQKKDSIFAGGKIVEELIDNFCLEQDKNIELTLVPDGSTLSPGVPAMYLEGKFQDIVEFETTYLGIMARCTRVATNVRKVVNVANGKPVLFFPARFDVPETQFYDGYAAAVGGASGCSTYSQMNGYNKFLGGIKYPVGTMSHAMIANFNGDTLRATLAVIKSNPNEECWPLVDFHNDCAGTAVEIYNGLKADGLEKKMTGIRLDTSEKMVDFGLVGKYGLDIESEGIFTAYQKYPQYKGVCVELVKYVREQLDYVGATDVKICVSGGFKPEKIISFEDNNAPVDVYAVGEYFISGENPFTSDIVGIFDKSGRFIPMSKIGRGLVKNPDAVIRIHSSKQYA